MKVHAHGQSFDVRPGRDVTFEHNHECERCGQEFWCHGDLDLNSADVVVCQIPHDLCADCQKELDDERPRLTRQERLEGLADRGRDTWDDVRGER